MNKYLLKQFSIFLSETLFAILMLWASFIQFKESIWFNPAHWQQSGARRALRRFLFQHFDPIVLRIISFILGLCLLLAAIYFIRKLIKQIKKNEH